MDGCDKEWVSVTVQDSERMTCRKEFKTCRSCRLARTQALLGNSQVVLQQLWMTLHAQQHEAVPVIPMQEGCKFQPNIREYIARTQQRTLASYRVVFFEQLQQR